MLKFHNADEEIVPYDGSELRWRISAYGLIVKDEKIWLIKSNEEKLFDVPGGGIEFGETIAQAIQREAIEEAGIKVKVGPLVDIGEDYFYHRTKQQFCQTVLIYHAAELIEKVSEPTDQRITFAGFVPIADLDKYPTTTVTKHAIQKILGKV
jgi:8-oxo-dGTP pyrophosphatase MutT (NUDIX family)